MTLQSKSKITCITRFLLTSMFLIVASVAAAQTNTFPPSGSAGIGTTSPVDALQIVKDNGGLTLDTATSGTTVPVFRFSTTGTGRASIQYRPDLPGLAFQTGGIAYPAQSRMVLTDSGNVGVGTTSPLANLHVKGTSHTAIQFEPASPSNYAYMNFGNGSSYGWQIGKDVDAGSFGGAGFYIYEVTTGQQATRFAINKGGNVGIGTPIPSYKLDIQNGQINASGGLCIAGDCKSAWSQLGSSQWTSNSNNINNNNTGNVGVGTTNPNTHLHVSGSGNQAVKVESTTAAVEVDLISNATSGGKWSLGTGWASVGVGKLWFYDNNAAATRMVIDANGYLGIGTTAPGTKLEITGTHVAGKGLLYVTGASAHGYLTVDTDTPTTKEAGIIFAKGGSTKFGIYVPANSNDLRFFSAADNVTFQAGGNVGIGTTNPTVKLDVNGNSKVTGDFNVTGTITGGTINAKYQDVAEWVPATHALPAGTVVVLNPTQSNQVMPSAQAYDTRVAGVVSARPGLTLGEAGADKVLVATVGRVKVKVDASRGAINIGDLLVTSDVEGVAMKSQPLMIQGRPFHSPGTLIGKALEPLTNGQGQILVLLSLQ